MEDVRQAVSLSRFGERGQADSLSTVESLQLECSCDQIGLIPNSAELISQAGEA